MTEEWEVEEIPRTACLYLRMHRSRWPTNTDPLTYIPAGGFVEKPDEGCGMSTDWAKYSSPTESRMRAEEPEKNAIFELLVSDIEEIGEQLVKHEPDRERNNRAHTAVYGVTKRPTRIRREYSRIAKLLISYTDPI